MNSLVLSAFSRLFFVLMALVSLYVLYRGHNEPGGGFVGGLIAAAGFCVLALADGVSATRRAVPANPLAIAGIGLVVAIAGGLPGLFLDGSFLAHQWGLPAGIFVSTTMVFDLGVYLVVLGGILAMVFRFYEEDEA